MATTTPKFVRWAVLIGIVIALNLFFMVARSLVLPEPKFEDYCPTTVQPAATEEACVAQEGTWVETPADPSVTAVTKPSMLGYCDLYSKCQPVYEDATEEHALYTFVIMMGLGVLSLIVGVLPLGSSIVSSGLSYGGVLALIIAGTGYWGTADNLLKLAMAALALGVLLYVGLKRFKD